MNMSLVTFVQNAIELLNIHDQCSETIKDQMPFNYICAKIVIIAISYFFRYLNNVFFFFFNDIKYCAVLFQGSLDNMHLAYLAQSSQNIMRQNYNQRIII